MAKVIRNGNLSKLPASELVPGDLVEASGKLSMRRKSDSSLIIVGDKIPADLRLIEVIGTAVRVDQSLLTGESAVVQKYCSAISVESHKAVIQDQTNMLFKVSKISGDFTTNFCRELRLQWAVRVVLLWERVSTRQLVKFKAI